MKNYLKLYNLVISDLLPTVSAKVNIFVKFSYENFIAHFNKYGGDALIHKLSITIKTYHSASLLLQG